LKYKDAGKTLETVGPVADKYYPRFSIDHKEGLEIDDIVPLRGRVCGIHKSDGCSSIEVEVTEVGIPDVTGKAKEPRNEADRELEKLNRR